MNTETLRKAVEYADGWAFDDCKVHKWDYIMMPGPKPDNGESYAAGSWFRSDYKPALAALASQLISQVDALKGYGFVSGHEGDTTRALIYGPKFRAWHGHLIHDVTGPNRDENSIEACVQFFDALAEDKT